MPHDQNPTTPNGPLASLVGLGLPTFYVLSPRAEREMKQQGMVLDAPYRVHSAIPDGTYYGIYDGDPDEYIAELDRTMLLIEDQLLGREVDA